MVLIGFSHCLYASALVHQGVAILQDDLANLHSAPMSHWDDIKYFLAFARTGSMAAAATKLGVNQSTVQRRLAALEERLGRRLLARRRGGYSLTESGEELRRSAERIEEAVSAFERDAVALDKGLTGAVRVTAPGDFAEVLRKSGLVDTFHSRHPELRLELLVTDRCLDLSKGEADIAIRAGEPRDEALVGRKILDVQWAVYASRSYIERHGAPKCVEDINQHFVVVCDDSQSECRATRWLRSVAPRAKIAVRCETGHEQVGLVKSGAGLAPMLTYKGDADLIRVIDSIGFVTPFYLLMHKDIQRNPRIRAFADFVGSEIKAFRALLLGRLSESPPLPSNHGPLSEPECAPAGAREQSYQRFYGERVGNSIPTALDHEIPVGDWTRWSPLSLLGQYGSHLDATQ
jgi:DNA-binding transcriptional LysR family regulator